MNNLCKEDNTNVREYDFLKPVKCISCSNTFNAVVKFTSRDVTCPNCNTKQKVRFFKNGNVSAKAIVYKPKSKK